MEFFEREEEKYRPPPKRHRNYAFVNPLFWITWAACSALIFSIIINVIHVPPKGARWETPARFSQPLPPEPPRPASQETWSDTLGRKLLGRK